MEQKANSSFSVNQRGVGFHEAFDPPKLFFNHQPAEASGHVVVFCMWGESCARLPVLGGSRKRIRSATRGHK